MNGVYIGALSGTSMDAFDAAAVRFPESGNVELLAAASDEMPPRLRERMIALQCKDVRTPQQVTAEHAELGRAFAKTVARLIRNKLEGEPVRAIGLHGQTLRHRPCAAPPFTLQIGDPHVVAKTTRCIVVSDFRQSDLAVGGQGAPLAPAFHRAFFSKAGEARAIVNIGGISNVTRLESDGVASGFDCGPGNVLLDAWVRRHGNEAYDRDGAWARSGVCDKALLARLVEDDFFRRTPPKSACATDFGLAWLERYEADRYAPEDVQATLVELTATCIVTAVSAHSPSSARVFVCGGGVHNNFLMERLRALLKMPVESTQAAGLNPDWVEASGFAWLARRCLSDKATDLTGVTGAREPAVLGRIYRN